MAKYISDNVLIVQELMHDLQSPSLIAIKINMKRAYDCMSWEFLWHVVENFRFIVNGSA